MSNDVTLTSIALVVVLFVLSFLTGISKIRHTGGSDVAL